MKVKKYSEMIKNQNKDKENNIKKKSKIKNELNEQMQKNHFKTKEIPVHIHYTDYSLWKWQKNSNSIKLWLQMIYQKIFFR